MDADLTSPVVMQLRCIFCKREQYMPAVWDISFGRKPCTWCVHTPPVFTDEAAYREALRDEDWRAVLGG